jgi:hypothetical protein
LRRQLLRYSLSGGCCDSMCYSARRHARDNEISRCIGRAGVLSVMAMVRQQSLIAYTVELSQRRT